MSDLIEVFEYALDPDTCQKLINVFENNKNTAKSSSVISNDGSTQHHSVRRSDGLPITQNNCGELYNTLEQTLQRVYTDYCNKYPVLRGVRKVAPEPMSILCYANSEQQYSWHVDGADKGLRYRFLSFVIYLNTVYDGGETEFRIQQRKVKPRVGCITVFPSGWTHEHRGLPPISNPKYIIATWYRFGDKPLL